MQKRSYQLTKTILSIHHEEGKDVCLLVPGKAVIEVATEDLEDSHTVNVHWGAKILTMFTKDVQERACLCPEKKNAPTAPSL